MRLKPRAPRQGKASRNYNVWNREVGGINNFPTANNYKFANTNKLN
jgi:hypothetical protein